jgi:methionyl-tRNA formyltransferase
VPQPADGVSLAPKIRVEDARIDWSAPALRVDRVVRACSPAPGAWTLFRGERLKVRTLAPAPGHGALGPGVVEAGKKAVHVGTGSHPVELQWVQPQGKKPMRAADWARGVRIEAGERLGDQDL